MAKSIFQISPLDAEISNQSDSFGAVDLTAPNLPAIGAPPPLPAIAVPRPAASARMPGAVKPPATLIPVFEQAALRYDVPLNILMALGEQESRYNPMAVGTPTQWGRAKGVMQYLDSTASNLGINPFDPKQSIDAAAKQIRERLNKGYSMADAVKEHFAGPDRKRWRAKTRVYGDEVLARAARLKQELAPRYAGRADNGAAALERISRVKPPMSVEESRARDNVPPGTDDRGWLETGAGLVADAGNLLASGVNMAAEDLTELVGRIPVLGKGITAAVDRADRFINGKGTQEIFEDTQKWVAGNFTPEMRAARQKQFVLENEDGYAFGPAWSDPRTYMSGLLESVPEMVLTMGPAGRLAKGAYTGAIAKGLSRAEAAKRAATVATVAGGVAEGLLGGAQSGREVRREVMEMPRETLEKSEALQDMMRDGLSFEDARAALAENASTQAFIVSGTLTGMFGGFGDRALAKIITGPAQGRIKSAALGALSEGLLEEMPQSVGQQVSQNLAVRDADPTRPAGQGAVNAGVTGAVIGGMMGGGLGAVAPRAGGADEQQAVPPAPTPEAPPAPPPAPSGPLGRALARATAAAEAVPIAVPEPLPPEIAQQPMVLATDGTEYPVTLIGETADAVWVKTESGEELQIPRAEIEAGNVQLSAQPTIEPDLTVAPGEAEALSTPPTVKDDLTAGAPGNLKETLTSSPSQDTAAIDAADITGVFKGIAGGISAGLIDMYQAQASAGSVKDKSGTVSPVLQVAKKVRARRGDVELSRDEVEAIALAVDGVSATGQERQLALQSVVDQFAPEAVDPETGEILPADPAAPAAPVEQEQATVPPAPGPNETELRARLKYLSSQARSGSGWTRAMIAEKQSISAAIDAMNATATPAAEPEQPITPAAAIAAAEAEAAMSPLNDRPEPTDAQKDAGNYKLGHAIVGGLDVSIENPAGTSRRPEWPPLKHSYGYVKRSEGADGDHVDVFLGPKAGDPTNPVFIVDQVNKDGSFDEHKVMVGFADKGAARRGYLANYEKGWQGLGDITPMPFEQFKDWVKDPTRTTAPAGTKVAATAAAEPIAPAPVTPAEPSAELTPSPRASSPAAPPPPSNRPAPVARREVSKKHPNPFVRAGERYRLSHDVDYLRAGEEYAIESAGKRTAYFRDPRNGGGTSLNNIIIEKAIRDGVMKRVDDEPAPALRAEGSTKEAEKRRQIDAGFAANRAVLANFKKGDAVEFDVPGTFTQPDGNKREGRLVRGTVTEVLSKEQGTLKVTEPSGAWANVPARNLRKQAAASAQTEAPAAVDKKGVAEAVTQPAAFAQNKLFTAEKVEAARARLREKMNRINSGIDPEVLVDGMTIAGAYIESGVRKFADYAKAMRADFGPRITPYLLSFWEGARNYPGLDTKGMTSPDVSRTQYAKLLEAGLPVEESTALGTEVARPKAKANAPTGRTLRADWGVEHIDGWTPIDGGQNSPTDYGLKGGLKDAFLADATTYLRAVAATLRPLGFVPHVNAKGKDENPVSRNAAGPAVSGDVSLYLRNPETGAQVYATIGATAMRGAVPTNAAGVSVMYRVSMKDGDRQAVAGVNRWAPTDLTAIDLADTIAWEAGRNKPELTRDAVAEPEPVGQGVDRRGVPPVQGGREPTAQPGDAPADIEPVGAAQPADVVEPASAGTDGQDGVPGAAEDVGSGEGTAEPGLPDNGRARDGGAGGTAAGARNADAGRQRSADSAPGQPAEPEGQVSRSDEAAGRGKRGRDAGQLTEPDLFAPAAETDTPALSPAPPPSPARSGPGNFSIANPLDIVGGGPVARFDRNRLAIETYNAIRDEGRSATADEQRVLAGYTGWGSFGQELFQGSWDRPMPKDNWKDRDRWLRDHMGREEWESAQRSITNAHYTDPPTVMAMWAMMQRMGFQGGRVLEPSMGIGNFFGMMPADIASRTTLAGIELDSLTGGMAQLLYPDANIRVMGYQESKTPDDFYDAVIGNWPFENTVIADRRYDRLSPYLHDYFFLKALDQARPGGIVMGITSSGTMDKKATGIRRELAKKADLVAAFRLPSGAFAEYAGTKVVTDIVILRKRSAPISLADDAGWINSVPYQTPNGEVFLNEYYVANPSNVVGTVDFGHGTTRGRPGLIVHRPDDMSAQLQRIVEAVPAAAYTADSRAQQVSYIANHTTDREGALTRTKDGLFVVRGEQLAPAAEVERFALKDAAKTAARVNQLERLIDMRGKYAALIEAERTGEPEAARKALKRDYDGFVKAHGTLAGSFGLSYMRKIDDPFYPSLAALEIAGKPAAILSRSTTRTAPAIANPTIAEAFVLERNAAVNPSLDAIAARAAVAPEDAKAQLLDSGAVFELPNGDVVPSDMYLSGNVREKLRQARAAVAEGMAKLQRNVDALVAVVPADVPYFKIETQLGATWIAPDIYGEFVGHMLGLPDSKGVEVRYNGGRWTVRIDDRAKARPEARTGFGTEEYGFQRLVNAAFSNQSVTIRRKDSDGGSYVDHAATEEVNGKIAEMRTKFADWLWSDPERRVAVEAEYNEVRNAFATPRFDGSFLRFEGMALSLGNGPFDLRQHQVDAIWRALVTRRSLNAHEVGTGKTFTMGGIAIESRRYGIAKKPLILAHNANSKSVAAEIQQMYPASKILYIDNLTPATIDVKMRQIANDDWDAIVVPHSLIDRFAFREDTLMAMAREEIAALEEEAYAAAEEDGADLKAEMLDDPEELKKLRSPTAKELVKMRQRIIETIKKQSSRASREGAISFEELGVDMLMVDEAHEFKKPPISTRMKMKGLNTGTSDRSIALSFLTRYVRAQNAGGNIHLFTGTPVTNTLTEVFHMMRYIMAEEMQAAGIDQWDGWFGSFAREVMDVEQNAAAEYEAVTRLAGFINVPELRRMIGQYMDTVFAADMPEMQPRRTASGKTMADELSESERAELLNGRTEGAQDRPYKKVINVTSDLTPQQKVIFEQLRGYAKAWRGFTGKERKDAMIAGSPESPIITEGLANKASFDVRLYDGEALAGQEGKAGDDEGSKASRVIANVKEVFDSSPLATQVIFAEQGFSNRVTRSLGRSDDGKRQTRTLPYFSTIRDIVERLVQSGIPRAQIAVVDGGTSKEKRKEIAAAMNAAKIRVVIGSTATLGVGVNMQKNLRAMHHMDAPWMPGDLEQRNGRGQRQGNQWNTVLEYRYLTDRLDGRRWQVLAIKQRFITAFLKADDSARVIEGEAAADEQSDILQSFAEAAGDPRILIRQKLRAQLDGAQRRERLHTQGIANALSEARMLNRAVAETEAELADVDQRGSVAAVEAIVTENAGNGFSITVDGEIFDKRQDADEAISKWGAFNLRTGDAPVPIGKFGRYELLLGWPGKSTSPELRLTIDGNTFAGTSVQRLERALRKFGPDIERRRARMGEQRAAIGRLEAVAGEPFHMAGDLDRYAKALTDLEADIQLNPVPPPSWLRTGAPVDTGVGWHGAEFTVSGHRWTADGWFVLASDGSGDVTIPYLEARDAQGIAIYDERPFEAPQLIDKEVKSDPAQSAESTAAHSVGPATGGGFVSADGLRQHLLGGAHAPSIERLLTAGKLVIHGAGKAMPGADGRGDVQAVTTRDGRVHLAADRLTSETALPVLLHEMFHAGARPLIGNANWQTAMQRLETLYRSAALREGTADRGNQAYWKRALARVEAAAPPAGQEVEEFAAYAIEERAQAPSGVVEAIDRLTGALKAWMLRRFAVQVGTITPAQLQSLAAAALRAGITAPRDGTFTSRVVPRERGVDAATPGMVANLVTKAMDGKTSVLGVIPLRPLLSEMASRLPAAGEYLTLKQAMDQTRDQWHSRSDAVAQPWLKFRMLHRADNRQLMDLMHEATLAGVDPAAPFTSILTPLDRKALSEGPGTEAYDEAADKARRDESRKADHGRLGAAFAALPVEGKRIYADVRDTYRALSAAFEQVLLDNLSKALDIKFRQAKRAYDAELIRIAESDMAADARELAQAKAEREWAKQRQLQGWAKGARMTRLRAFFETNNMSGPYFPLARFGNFFVTVRDGNSDQVISFSRFEKPAEQQAFAKQMKEAGHGVTIGVLDDGGALKAQVDARFVTDIESILEGADVSEGVRDAVWQRWLETMPDMSIRTSRIHRKGRAGFSSDAIRAFGHHMFHGSHQLARLKYALDLDETVALARDQAKTMPDPVRAGLIVNEMARRNQFIMNPTGGPLAQALTSAAFIYHLSVSPAAAMVNTAQTAVMGIPILAAYDGRGVRSMARATFELNKALRDFAMGRGHAGRSSSLTTAERAAMDEAYDTGLIERTQSHDLAGVGETGVEYSAMRTKVMGAISWAFHHTERLNREVTFLAAYRMARKKGEPHNMAIDRGAELTWKTHFDYQNTSRPRVMQSDTAKVLLTFRNFQVNMLWRLFRDAHQAVKGGTKQERREARMQLAGVTGMMMLSAGVRGTWMYGIAMVLASLLFGDDAEDDFSTAIIEALGPQLGGMALNGVPGHTMGVDISQRIGMPDLWFRSPDRQLEGATEFDYWAMQFLGAGVGVLRNAWTGASMIADGKVYRGVETMMPKFAKDLMRSYRYMDEGARTLKGDPIIEDMPAADALKQALGFMPAELAERYDRNRSMKNKEQRIIEQRGTILSDYDQAMREEGDTAAIEARIDRFNEKNPDYPITVRTIRQSMKSRQRMRDTKIGGVNLNPKLADRLQEEAVPLVYEEEAAD